MDEDEEREEKMRAKRCGLEADATNMAKSNTPFPKTFTRIRRIAPTTRPSFPGPKQRWHARTPRLTAAAAAQATSATPAPSKEK